MKNNIEYYLNEKIKVKPSVCKEFLKFLLQNKAYEAFTGRMACKAYTPREKERIVGMIKVGDVVPGFLQMDSILLHCFAWAPQVKNVYAKFFNAKISSNWETLNRRWASRYNELEDASNQKI